MVETVIVALLPALIAAPIIVADYIRYVRDSNRQHREFCKRITGEFPK